LSFREAKSGRKVEAAMQQIPMASSTMDQMDTFETAKRKSTVRFTMRMYSILVITVKPALYPSVSIKLPVLANTVLT
jgi:hypothetical protein